MKAWNAFTVSAGLLSTAIVLVERGFSIQPRLFAAHLLAYMGVVLLPHGLISEVGRWIRNQGTQTVKGGSSQGDTGRRELRHGGAVIGVLERTFIFLLFLMSNASMLAMKDAINSLALIVATKALFRFGEKTTEAKEWYIIGTLLSITSGVLLSWLTLGAIWGEN